ILTNHNHGDQSGGAAYMKEKTGAPLMAGFGEIPYIEHGMFNPPAIPVTPAAEERGGGRGGPPRYPPAHVDRALFDGDVIKVVPLRVPAYLIPGIVFHPQRSRTPCGMAAATTRSSSFAAGNIPTI